MSDEIGSKRLKLLHEMVPTAADIAALVNPVNPQAKFDIDDLLAAAPSLIEVFHAREQDIDEFFSALAARHTPAFIVLSDNLFCHPAHPNCHAGRAS
jgi:putative ABC transport system substrate-binding protein